MPTAKSIVTFLLSALIRDLTVVVGYFDGNSTSDPTVYDALGLATTTPFAYSATGIITMNLERKYARLLGAFFQVGANTPDDYKVCVDRDATDVTSTTAPKVVLTCFDGSGAAAAPATTQRVWFVLFLSDRSDNR